MTNLNILQIVPNYFLKRFILLVLLSFLLLLLEIISLGSLIPFLDLLDKDYKNTFLISIILNKFSFINENNITYFISVFLIIIFTTKGLGIILIKYYQTLVSHKTMNIISKNYLIKILSLDQNNFYQRKKSDLIRDLNHETKNFSFGVLRSYLNLSSELIILIGISIFLLILQPIYFSLLLIILFFLVVFYLLFVKNFLYSIGEKRVNNEANKIQSINDIIYGIKEIKIYNLENFFIKNFISAAEDYIRYPIKNSIYQQLPRFFLEIIFLISAIIIFATSLIFEKDYIDVIKIISIFGVASLRIIPSITSVATNIQSLHYNKATIGALRKFLNLSVKSEVQSNIQKNITLNLTDFQICDLNFHYPKKKIFKNLNLKIKVNSITGIIGKSGTGKSTFLDIICGLTIPQSGYIKFADQKISFHDKEWLKNISYVSQIPYIFKDSIKKNIALGQIENDIDNQKIIDILKKVNLYDLISEGNSVINYQVSDEGSNLSVGQKQRLGIARALYKSSPIIIFDEPTSSLDEFNKKDFINIITRIKKEKTIILISHDETLIDICDDIIKF